MLASHTRIYIFYTGDSQGHYTYERGAIRSVIDYSITPPSLWPFVRTFQIGLHNSVLSNHSIILTELNLYTTLRHTPSPFSAPSPLIKFDWTPEAFTRLSAKLQEPHTQLQIELLERRLHLPTPDVDNIVSSFTDLIVNATKQVVKFRKKGPPQKNKNQAINGLTNPYAPLKRKFPP